MEAVFDLFLKSPNLFWPDKAEMHPKAFDIPQSFPKLAATPDLIKWHVAVFIGEFTVPKWVFPAHNIREPLPDNFYWLNKSGQELFHSLKAGAKNKPASE